LTGVHEQIQQELLDLGVIRQDDQGPLGTFQSGQDVFACPSEQPKRHLQYLVEVQWFGVIFSSMSETQQLTRKFRASLDLGSHFGKIDKDGV
jgi:hypothetical protein